MTNIEKVKRILDAGHWAKATSEGFIITITSYNKNEFTYTDKNPTNIYTVRNPSFQDCTIEVIQRIPTPYVAGDKVLVLSNPSPEISYKEAMAGKVCEVYRFDSEVYHIYELDKSDHWIFPSHCLAPAFDEEPTLSGKEAKVVIDGKEYTCVIK